MEMDLIVKAGLWLACGMIACITCIIEDKAIKGYSTISIIDIAIVCLGPISLFFIVGYFLSNINIKI